MRTWIKENALYIAWMQATVAMAGSLYFSEVMKLPPCLLCWYQRIAIYPLVLVLGAAIVRGRKDVFAYSFPLALIGWAIAAYHNLLYYKIIPESIAPCTLGISCTTRQIEWLGFVTIPLLSLAAFTVIVIFLLLNRKENVERGDAAGQ